MFSFHAVFPELGARETRSIWLEPEEPRVEGRYVLPSDDYTFVDYYCVERGCDCRRVILNVVSHASRRHVATISHAFDPPRRGSLTPQTFLDPINKQSEASADLLHLFREVCLPDREYMQRLERHYRMMKDALDDPTHVIHRALWTGVPAAAEPGPGASGIRPPPPRGRKKWR